MSKEFSPEVKKMLEGLTGKPYKEVTLDDIEKISPRTNNDIFMHNGKIFFEDI